MNDRSLSIPLTPTHDILTPLRYPGGKSVLSGFVSSVVEECDCAGGEYVEPFAGGAGLALRLLGSGVASSIVINDLDARVYAFWNAAVNHSRDFLEIFDATNPTIEEWHRQKQILKSSEDPVEVGFAFFFVNRTSRSGVINGGVIGGLAQQGTYKIDARYNKPSLRKKLVFLQEHANSITVSNVDGAALVRSLAGEEDVFLFLDPPYVRKGSSLYLNALQAEDHEGLANALHEAEIENWLLTYDDDPLVRKLYGLEVCGSYQLDYSAYRRHKAAELMIASESVRRSISHVLKGGSCHG